MEQVVDELQVKQLYKQGVQVPALSQYLLRHEHLLVAVKNLNELEEQEEQVPALVQVKHYGKQV